MYNYNSFITESKKYNDKNITEVYWNYGDLKEIGWTDISTSKKFSQGRYQVVFSLDKEDYAWNSNPAVKEKKRYRVFLDDKDKEAVLLPDAYKDKFWERFKEEFEKHPFNYAKNLSYVPKCVGDIRHYIDSEKFGI